MLQLIQAVSQGFSGFFGTALTGTTDTLSAMLLSLIGLLPNGGALPQGVHDAAIYFGNSLGKVDFILPVDVMVSCLMVAVSLKLILYGFHLTMWVVNLIRGVATQRFDGGMLPDEGYATVAQRTAKFWG